MNDRAPARRIGILGGTFDPIHRGHLDVASAAEAALSLTRVFVIPSNIPPHRPQPQASSFHRFAMVALTVAGRAGWLASDLELRSQPPSYTATTLEAFHQRGYTPAELFFLIGADAFTEIQTWKQYPRLLSYAHFVVVSRPGCPVQSLPVQMPHLAPLMTSPALGPASLEKPMIILIDAPTADVSSTAIRELRAAGESITGMVDLGVQQHIEQHGLYAGPIPGRRAADASPNPAAGRLHGQG
jgi:nicotinate-nucleotide adenylyltransferase